MDALTIQWGWFGGNPVSGPTPPTPPAPADDGDAAYSFSRRDIDTAEERYHWRRKADPWALIRRWLPRPLPADQFGPVAAQPGPETQRRQWAQLARVVRVSRLTRRR